MEYDQLLSKIHSLSDLELAFLLSLIAREHCQIRTASSADIPDLVAELRLVASSVFGLQSTVISCTPHTTLEDFASALLLPTSPSTLLIATGRSVSPFTAGSIRNNSSHRYGHETQRSSLSFRPSSLSAATSAAQPQTQTQTSPSIPPVVLATNLDQAPQAVQIQALELLRTRRVFTRTSVHAAPKTFLFVAVVADDGQAGLNRWLNDWFYLAHQHAAEDGYPNLEDEEEGQEEEENDDDGDEESQWPEKEDEASPRRPLSSTRGELISDAASTDSSESVVVAKKPTSVSARRRASSSTHTRRDPLLTESDIALLAHRAQQVRLDIDVARYQMNLVSFLRMHRAVAGGISPTATHHFGQLMRSLAPLHGLDYVTPSLVQLAARKIYLHRVQIVPPERERSLQWGSERAAVEALLEGVGPEEVIEDVLAMVTVPL